MNVLVLGGAASGKSAFAEKTACARAKNCGSPLVYLATLNPASDGDTAERIQKHRAARSDKGFVTVEWCDCAHLPNLVAGTDAAHAVADGKCVTEADAHAVAREACVAAGGRAVAEDSCIVAARGKSEPVVLLEDMGNLVANYLYPLGKPPRQTGAWSGSQNAVDAAVDELVCMLQKISAQCMDFVCVSNEIMLGGELPEGVRFYGEVLAALNAQWAAACDEVHAVVAGIPLRLK